MTALCLQDPKLCKLAEFRGHGASFYSQIIRQFLTVEGDGEIVGTFHFCLMVLASAPVYLVMMLA